MVVSTGMTRKVDPVGRIVFPMELRRTLDWNEGDAIEILVDGNNLVLRKFVPVNMEKLETSIHLRNMLDKLDAEQAKVVEKAISLLADSVVSKEIHV